MPEMDYTDSRFSLEDGIATFTLARPDIRNALTARVREEFADMIRRVRLDPGVAALVITGDGDHFCAGGDVKAMNEGLGGADARRNRVLRLHDWLEDLHGLDCPVIAAVDGWAAGGGFSLALIADFVLATPRARFASVFAKIGLVPDMALLYTLPRIVGLARAKEITYSARTVGAEEARSLGIVLSLHAPETLQADARAFAARFKETSKPAIAMTKQLLNRSFAEDYRSMADAEASAQSIAFDTDYHRDAVARFARKEPLRYDWDGMERRAKKGDPGQG